MDAVMVVDLNAGTREDSDIMTMAPVAMSNEQPDKQNTEVKIRKSTTEAIVPTTQTYGIDVGPL